MPRTAAQKRWQEQNAERVRAYRSAYYERNKDWLREVNKKNRENNRERTRYYGNKHNLKRYGLTPEDKEALLAAQGSVCKICGSQDPGHHGWHVDHCHKTGVVRGLLCKRCNIGIGLFGDDPDLLRLAVKYLDAVAPAERPNAEASDPYY